MHNRASFYIALLFIPCISCGFWAFPPLRVLQVSTDGLVSVEFSDKPCESSIRRAFKLIADGVTQNGSFSFSGNSVFFYPENGLAAHCDYELVLSVEAESVQGNSLETEYVKRFSTRTHTEPFCIEEVSPPNTGVFTGERDGIVLTFSAPVDQSLFADAVRFTPSFTWLYDFPSPNQARILPAELLLKGKRYVLELDSSLADIHGNHLKNTFMSSFTVYPDAEAPDFTLSAESSGFNVVLHPGTEAVLPSDAELVMQFSESVKIEALQSLVSVLPPLAVTVKANPESRSSARILFDSPPDWNMPYTLTVRGGLSDDAGNTLSESRFFPFISSLEKNRPPQIIKAFFDLYPDEHDINRRFTVVSPDLNFGTLLLDPVRYNPSLSAQPVAADIYFAVRLSSESAGLSLVSVLQNIRIAATNGCAIISLKKADILTPDSSLPITQFLNSDPDFSDGGKLMIIRFALEVENRAAAGFVIFTVQAGLSDSFGNKSVSDWVVTLNKN